MNIKIELTQEIVEKWCKANKFELVKLYKNGEIKPLKRNIIIAEGIEGIIERVCKSANIDISDIHIKTRKVEILEARQIAHTIARKHIKVTDSVIGNMIGMKSPSTVINSSNRINGLIETDGKFRKKHNKIIRLYGLQGI